MHRSSLEAGAFAQSLRRPTGRRAECHTDILGLKNLEDGPHERRLADTGSTGDHRDLRCQRLLHGGPLTRRQLDAEFALRPVDRLVRFDPRPGWVGAEQAVHSLGEERLCLEQGCKKDVRRALERRLDERALLELEPERPLEDVARDSSNSSAAS